MKNILIWIIIKIMIDINYKNNDRYDYNKEREEEARRDILKKLNLKINNNNENNNMHDINELLINDKNYKNKKENKYSWNMLSNMKSHSLVDERELNNLIN